MMPKNKKLKIINWILNILIIIFIIVGVYLFLARILGSSPTDFHFILWIVGLFVSVILKLFNLTYTLNREVGELNVGVKNGFKNVKTDIIDVKENLHKFGKDIQEIKLSLRKRGRTKRK